MESRMNCCENDDESNENCMCTICRGQMVINDDEPSNIVELNCHPNGGMGHFFHRECIELYEASEPLLSTTKLDNRYLYLCPTCRKDYSGYGCPKPLRPTNLKTKERPTSKQTRQTRQTRPVSSVGLLGLGGPGFGLRGGKRKYKSRRYKNSRRKSRKYKTRRRNYKR